MPIRKTPKKPSKSASSSTRPYRKTGERSKLETHSDIRRELKKNIRKLTGGYITPTLAQTRSKLLSDLAAALPPEAVSEIYTPPDFHFHSVPSGSYLIPSGPGGSLKAVDEDAAREFYRMHPRQQLSDGADGAAETIEREIYLLPGVDDDDDATPPAA